MSVCCVLFIHCFKHKTAYEMRISDWSSDVCSSDLGCPINYRGALPGPPKQWRRHLFPDAGYYARMFHHERSNPPVRSGPGRAHHRPNRHNSMSRSALSSRLRDNDRSRSEEHTSELQSLMRISYAVFCLKKKKSMNTNHKYNNNKSIKF